MADYIVTSGELTSVANAIREKNGTSSSLSWPNGFVEGINSGGGSWQTVFEGSVTTAKDGDLYTGTFNTQVTADTIKVTFNGVEYTCEGQSTFEGYSYGATNNGVSVDWSEYPFIIDGDLGVLTTQTAGTYTLKIEEEQSGGSSDFSTAEVTVNGIGGFIAEVASLTENGLSGTCFKSPLENSFTVVLYQGETIMEGISGQTPNFTIPEGETNIVADDENSWYVITGDCTITIS